MRRLENQAMPVSMLTKPDEHQEDNATGQKPAATKQNNKPLERCSTAKCKQAKLCIIAGKLEG